MKQLSVMMLMILWFSKGSAPNECDQCFCCKNGRKWCQDYMNNSHYCLDGCIDGYFGKECTHKCSDNCLICTDQNKCQKCEDGYYVYGDWCYKCFKNCKSCSSSSDCLECNNGFFIDSYLSFGGYTMHCKKCKSVCKSCTNGSTCSECHDGYYLQTSDSFCYYYCPDKCTSCYSNRCTDCVQGHYGKSCEYRCNVGCQNGNCNARTGYCNCKTGFIGDKCDRCITGYAGDKCKECEMGKYGQYCNISCPEGCATNQCYRNGYCYSCTIGRHGNKCTESCPEGCANNKCYRDGNCKSCTTGRYGNKCMESCPKNCLHHNCNYKGECNTCNDGFVGDKCDKCGVGKYGQQCNIDCPTGCANNNCSDIGICYSCKPGRYGIDCSDLCSNGCDSDICTNNGDCFSCKNGFQGKKCDKCIAGKFGDICDQNCLSKCIACVSLTSCSACIERHWGKTCQQCPTNCLNCSSMSTCSSCENGFHGQICNEQCNANCFDNQCDQQTGYCSKECVAGFYGNFCTLKCSSNCLNTSCGRKYGECLYGCKTGYNGTKCAQSLELLKEDDNNTSFVIEASVGAGVLVMVVILLIAFVLLIKKRQRKSKEKEGIKTEDETMTYSVINDTNITAENNRTDDIETDRENTTYNVIQDSDLSTDNIYAKPIKPKRKTAAVKSFNRNSTEVTVNNPTYKKSETSQTETVKKVKNSKPPIASKPAQKYDNNVIPKPSAMQPTSHISHIQNDAALEIEEDIDCLSSRSKSVFLEEQKAAEIENADTYYNVAAVIKRKITLDKLPDFVAKKTKKDFIDEFQSFPAMLIKPYVDSQKRENRSKNRYKGIYPYDDSRVVLKEGDSDYINASYIDGYNKNKAYIASIGPTYKYMGDMSAFWIMVWQENVRKIVMLTNLEEGGVPKCDQYWPEKDFSLMFANIQVTCHTEENYADYTFRSFSVQKDSIKREIVQVHFTAWPDKGTPDDVTSLIEFRQKVNSTKTKLDGHILVHCSAGIGRTGTYIALDSITNEGETEGAVDIYAFVRNMREQRVNMIQTAEQYQYLHNALVHTLTFDSKAVEASVFSDYMKTHTEAHFGNMFEKLQASVEQRTDDEQEAVKRNKALVNKNRNGADIPGDRNRPRLFMAKTPGQSDYINAVYVNSFKNVNRFLIAQTPLPDTVEDFLTLIVQEKVSCVISMETMSSANKDVGIYCPADNQTLRKGAFTIKTERGDGTDQYLLKKMKISYKSKSGSEEVIVPHVQYTQWDNNKSIPEEPVKFVQFVKDMELKFSGTDTNRPMLVHCLTGAKKGGLFCVVSTLLEKTQIDQEVSVANTVRQIKYRRHLAVPDKEQYIFCHHCVNEYLRTFDIYSNFELKT